MHCARGARGPRGCMVRVGKAVSARPHCIFHTAGCHTAGPQVKDPPSELPPVPCQKWVVKERGRDQPVAPRRSAVLKPKAPESPELVAVILDDDL